MKKLLCLVVVALMLLSPVATLAVGETVTALEANALDVEFSNGYYGYCLDREDHTSQVGSVFKPADDTSAATSNTAGNSDVSQPLKVLFTQCFEDIFVSDGNGGYMIPSKNPNNANTVLGVVYHFTEGQYVYGDQGALVNKINAYNGPVIPDSGYVKTLANGDTVTFDFMVLEPEEDGMQFYFAYKLTVGQTPSHQHDHSDKWSTDGEKHWHECECGDKVDEDKHTGGEANCKEPAKCEVCGESYGNVDKNNHKGGTEVRGAVEATEFEPGYTGDTYCKDCEGLLEKGEEIPATHEHDHSDDWTTGGENHWHECECGDKKDEDEHTGGEATCKDPAVCEVCGETYGSKDEETHTGGTEVRGAVEATEFEPGYTGDAYCKGCDELLKEGEEIPATHEHDHSDDWTTDGENHWHECECGDKADEDEHTGGEANCKEPAVCEVCGESYGSKDEETHTGETEVRDAKEATESEPGYTGDTYCKGCDELLEEGEEIPVKQTPSHTHVYDEDWSSDEEYHWHECECGDKNDPEEHTFKGEKCIICDTVNPGYADEAPATGDDHGIFMWLMMSVLCLDGCVLIAHLRRKNRVM